MSKSPISCVASTGHVHFICTVRHVEHVSDSSGNIYYYFCGFSSDTFFRGICCCCGCTLWGCSCCRSCCYYYSCLSIQASSPKGQVDVCPNGAWPPEHFPRDSG